MAPDAKTFGVLQTYSTSDNEPTEYVPRDDESEAARLRGQTPNSDVHYLTDEELSSYQMQDFGMGLNPNDITVPRINKP